MKPGYEGLAVSGAILVIAFVLIALIKILF
jgi:hypothetical protein